MKDSVWLAVAHSVVPCIIAHLVLCVGWDKGAVVHLAVIGAILYLEV